MYKTGQKLMLAVVLISALLTAVIFVARRVGSDGAEENAESFAMIYSVKDEDIDFIEVKNASGSFSFERYEEKLVRADGKEESDVIYRIKDNPEMNLDQTAVKKFLGDFYQFHVTELVSSAAGDREKYGFGEEEISVTINKKDGTKDKLLLGGISDDENLRYVKTDGKDEIYAMSRLKEQSFINGLDVYRQRRLGNLDSYTLLSFSVTDRGERKLGIRYKNENDREVVTTDSITYVMTFPYNGAVNIEKFGELMKAFDEVYAVDFIEDNPKELSKYGLDDDSGIKAVIQDVEQNRHDLIFGAADEKGNVYTMYKDYDFVFTTKPDMYNAVKNINPADYIDKHTNIFSMDTVRNVTVTDTQLQRAYILEISRTGSIKYKINGKEAYDKAFRSVFQGIIGIKITGQAEEEKKDKELLDITFTFTDGSKKTSKFYEYDEHNMGVLATDGTYGLVAKRFINNIIEILEEFDENPSVEP